MGDLAFNHGGNIYEVKRKYDKEVIDFSASINPSGFSKKLKKIIFKDFSKIIHYPDPQARSVTGKIAQYWGIKEENILVGNGAAELIYLIASSFRPRLTYIPAPTFSEYERAVRAGGSNVQFLKLREKDGFGFNLPLPKRKADISFICNPNNPTGNLLIKRREPLTFLTKLLVVDEVFMDFLPDERKHTFIWQAVRDKRIIVLRSFTKFFALAGLRFGYVVAHSRIIEKFRCHQPPWSVNILAQTAAEAVLDDKEYIRFNRQSIEKERVFLASRLNKIKGLQAYPAAANFLLIKIKDENITSFILSEQLIQKGIFIRNCANFRGLNNKFIRIAVRSHKDNLNLIKALTVVTA